MIGVGPCSPPSRSARIPVAAARKISPLPWCAVEPTRASPSPTRRASRTQAALSSGASVTTTPMHEPAGAGAGSYGSGGSSRPAGTPSTVSRPRSPKLAITSTPTVCPDGTIRDAVPMPPLKPMHDIPVPLPTEPSGGGMTWPTESRACAQAARTSAAVTCIRRASDRNESSHSPTTGIATSSPIAGSVSCRISHAAS